MPVVRPPIGVVPFERTAIFIDGWNFKQATYDSFGIKVDFVKLLEYFTQRAILLRAYYYVGEWEQESIEAYIKLLGIEKEDEIAKKKEELLESARAEKGFWRFLDRNGYRVVRKPVRVRRDKRGWIDVKADLDLEMAIDMLTLADKCEKQILMSGDGDFVPVVNAVAARGVRVVIVSTQHEDAWRNAHYRASDELLDAADEFIPIESIRHHIEREERPARSIERSLDRS